jgi:hypothetical protein
MEENKFTETFELSRFIQEENFDELLHRFENDRKPEQIKQKNKVVTVEEFMEITKKSSQPTINDKRGK